MTMVPAVSQNRLQSFLSGRQEWCISRQRSWGVPVPVFYDEASGEPLLTDESVKHIQDLVLKHGTDCWWQMETNEVCSIDDFEAAIV